MGPAVQLRDLRVLRLYRFVNHLEALAKDRRDLVFVTDRKILQTERCGMAGGCALCTPRGCGRSVGILDKVKDVLNISRHLVQGQSCCPRPYFPGHRRIGVLTAHPCCDQPGGASRQCLHRIENIRNTPADGLMVLPDVALPLALFYGTNGVFPMIDSETVAMHKTASGKA